MRMEKTKGTRLGESKIQKCSVAERGSWPKENIQEQRTNEVVSKTKRLFLMRNGIYDMYKGWESLLESMYEKIRSNREGFVAMR